MAVPNFFGSASPKLRLSFSIGDTLLAGLLALTTLLVFLPATRCDFINYDDDLYVSENAHVQAGLTWSGVQWAAVTPVADNWHPLTVLSHMLVCQCFGLMPWAHHLANVLLHALNAALAFVWLRQATGSRWRSLLVAALFALHPLRAQSVAWVSERKDVLSVMFGLLTLIAYTRYAGQFKIQNSKFKISYALALIFFALGLMSKPMLVTLPFVLLLLDYWPLQRISNFEFRISNFKWLLLEKIPFLFLSVLDVVVTYRVQQQGGSLGAEATLPIDLRFENALVSYCRQMGKFFWPENLAIFYPYPGYWPLTLVILSAAALLVITGFCFQQRQQRPYLLTGWLWFCGMLVPVIGFLQTGLQAMADRHTYLPSLGLLLLVVWGTYDLAQRRRFGQVVFSVAGLAAVIGCIFVTRQQLGYWKNSETVFRRAIAVTKNNYIAHGNLGEALASTGKTGEAIAEFREAIRLEPGYTDGHYNLGIALGSNGQLDEAIEQFKKTIQLKPGHADAHYNLGVALAAKGDLDGAIREYGEVVRLRPDFAKAENNWGIALAQKNQLNEAICHFQQAVRLQPDFAEARENLSRALALKSGQPLPR
jgi:tetratricopeptide (TPR) repeat protein